jgi:hypothetical protein
MSNGHLNPENPIHGRALLVFDDLVSIIGVDAIQYLLISAEQISETDIDGVTAEDPDLVWQVTIDANNFNFSVRGEVHALELSTAYQQIGN